METQSYIQNTREWKSATDSKSGRVYYYNTRTKETTWNKPLELATPEERIQMLKKKQETMDFFREMENNIRFRIQRAIDAEAKGSDEYELGTSPHDIIYYRDDSKDGSTPGGRGRFDSGSFDGKAYPTEGRGRLNSYVNTRRVRTISTMDDEILLLMRQTSGGSNSSDDRRASFARRMSIGDEKTPYQSRAEAKESLLAQAKADAKTTDSIEAKSSTSKKRSNKKNTTTGNGNKRRNSTGTIYIETTMQTQDNTATIECVCVVIRAHMIQAAKENIVPLPEYDIFKDTPFLNSMTREQKEMSAMELVPSLAVVKDFFTMIFSKSQLESDCIIMALIYCERLVKETKGRLAIRYDNWRSILFACLVMASKVWDDLSMWNVDFSQVYPTFDLHRVNGLELAMLEALKYVIRVSASEYAKYYFHLRSMMVKLGLQHEADANYLRPLDIAGARKLQLSTEKYEAMTSIPLRRHSVHLSGAEAIRATMPPLDRNFSGTYDIRPHHQVMIEQIIHDKHMDADGLVHSARKKSNTNTPRLPGDGKPSVSPFKDAKEFK